ncbi:hypothetical protein I4F81_008964 [Pyropia yezoensis]|uniref:Uncharacterized protein n=1 Tax=Pyropia yezoensis TaxID=2788 RepID=A0ACC3C895_PYRYE|nr:hypothetical protein I4F81_008964 [Neopyropia yezoensis]
MADAAATAAARITATPPPNVARFPAVFLPRLAADATAVAAALTPLLDAMAAALPAAVAAVGRPWEAAAVAAAGVAHLRATPRTGGVLVCILARGVEGEAARASWLALALGDGGAGGGGGGGRGGGAAGGERWAPDGGGG